MLSLVNEYKMKYFALHTVLQWKSFSFFLSIQHACTETGASEGLHSDFNYNLEPKSVQPEKAAAC